MVDAVTPEDLPEGVVESIGEEIETAKKSFSFQDMISGIQRRSKKVLIFTNPEAVEAYAEFSPKVAALAEHAAEAQRQATATALPSDRGRAEIILAEHDIADKKLEALKVAMLEGAWSFHLRSIPNIAVKVARREARKAVASSDGEIKEQAVENQQAIFDRRLLVDAVEKVVVSDGSEFKPTLADIEKLEDALDTAQWSRLKEAMNEIIFLDAMVQAGVEEPGF